MVFWWFVAMARLVLPVVVLCLPVIWWRYRRARRLGWKPSAYPSLARVNRRTLGLRYAGAAIGLTAMPISGALGESGLGGMISTAVVACVIEVSIIVGEIVCFGMAREPGTASLERRTVGRYLSRWLVGLLAVLTAGVVTMIVWSWRLAADDGRSFSLSLSVDGQPQGSMSFGSFLGPYYAVPLAVTLGLALLLAAAALVVIVRRARNGADPMLAAWDDALRRRSARTVVATLIGAMAASLSNGANGLATVHRNAVEWLRNCSGLGDSCTVQPDVGILATGWIGTVMSYCWIGGMVLALGAAVFVLVDLAPVPDRRAPVLR